MPLEVSVYGTLVEVPDNEGLFDIEDWGTDNPDEQY